MTRCFNGQRVQVSVGLDVMVLSKFLGLFLLLTTLMAGCVAVEVETKGGGSLLMDPQQGRIVYRQPHDPKPTEDRNPDVPGPVPTGPAIDITDSSGGRVTWDPANGGKLVVNLKPESDRLEVLREFVQAGFKELAARLDAVEAGMKAASEEAQISSTAQASEMQKLRAEMGKLQEFVYGGVDGKGSLLASVRELLNAQQIATDERIRALLDQQRQNAEERLLGLMSSIDRLGTQVASHAEEFKSQRSKLDSILTTLRTEGEKTASTLTALHTDDEKAASKIHDLELGVSSHSGAIGSLQQSVPANSGLLWTVLFGLFTVVAMMLGVIAKLYRERLKAERPAEARAAPAVPTR